MKPIDKNFTGQARTWAYRLVGAKPGEDRFPISKILAFQYLP